ncbi:MAG: OmpH family outer membrane protein [Ferruginibacter sp.]|nr:OmpH family outer membrane protein [Cytophagales bacterium]
MRTTILLLTLALILSHASVAQKFGYIDTDFILSKMPAYPKAQAELDKFSAKSQKEIEDLHADVDRLEKAYQAEEILLTDEMKRERRKAVEDKKKEVQDKQNKLFGYEGGEFLKRKELIKPIQDEIFKAVEKVARAKQLAVLFDKASDITMIYTDPRHDYTDYVLEELGLGDKEDTGNKTNPDTNDNQIDK